MTEGSSSSVAAANSQSRANPVVIRHVGEQAGFSTSHVDDPVSKNLSKEGGECIDKSDFEGRRVAGSLAQALQKTGYERPSLE